MLKQPSGQKFLCKRKNKNNDNRSPITRFFSSVSSVSSVFFKKTTLFDTHKQEIVGKIASLRSERQTLIIFPGTGVVIENSTDPIQIKEIMKIMKEISLLVKTLNSLTLVIDPNTTDLQPLTAKDVDSPEFKNLQKTFPNRGNKLIQNPITDLETGRAKLIKQYPDIEDLFLEKDIELMDVLQNQIKPV